MLILILVLIIGSALAYVSHSNLMPVSVHLASYTLTDIPLFYVIVGSLVTGLLLSYLIYLIDSFGTFFTLRDKDQEIHKDKAKILELTKRIHQLELENEKIKYNSGIESEDRNAL